MGTRCQRNCRCITSLRAAELVGISRERVEAGKQAVDAVDEQPEMDARPPRDRVPRHRLAASSCRHQPGEHAEEGCLGDRRRAIHGYRAPAAEDGLLGAEQTLDGLSRRDRPPSGTLERSSVIDALSGASRRPRNLIDHRPLDAVFGAQRVGPALPAHATAVRRRLVQVAWNRRRKVRCDQGEELGLLPLGVPEVFVAVEPEEPRDRGVPNAVEEH